MGAHLFGVNWGQVRELWLSRHKRPVIRRFPFRFFSHLLFARFVLSAWEACHSLIWRNLELVEVYFLKKKKENFLDKKLV